MPVAVQVDKIFRQLIPKKIHVLKKSDGSCDVSDNEHIPRSQIAEGIQTAVQPNKLQHRDEQWVETAWCPSLQHLPTAEAACPFPVNSRKSRKFWVSLMATGNFLILA